MAFVSYQQLIPDSVRSTQQAIPSFLPEIKSVCTANPLHPRARESPSISPPRGTLIDSALPDIDSECIPYSRSSSPKRARAFWTRHHSNTHWGRQEPSRSKTTTESQDTSSDLHSADNLHEALVALRMLPEMPTNYSEAYSKATAVSTAFTLPLPDANLNERLSLTNTDKADKSTAGDTLSKIAASLPGSFDDEWAQSPRGVAEALITGNSPTVGPRSSEGSRGSDAPPRRRRSFSNSPLAQLRRRYSSSKQNETLSPSNFHTKPAVAAAAAPDQPSTGPSSEAHPHSLATCVSAWQELASWHDAAEAAHPGWQKRAVDLLRAAACENADAVTLYAAGTMLFEGYGTPSDVDAAAALFARAIALGHGPSHTSLAVARLFDGGFLGL